LGSIFIEVRPCSGWTVPRDRRRTAVMFLSRR
jgi:hypothetical protein